MKKILFLILGLIVGFTAFSQLTVNNTAPYNSPFWLAGNVLVDPNFNIIQPFDINGIPIVQPNSVQVGFFNAVGTPLGLDSGIVMLTDNITSCVPGNQDITTGALTPDTDLLNVLSQINSTATVLRDKTEIQFSFVATSDSISFRYVFASREYRSYTCSSFNDVFGFFLTGTNINGVAASRTVNLATIPSTNVPVAINTINQGFPSAGQAASNCISANPNYAAHSIFYVNNTNWVGQGNTNPNSQINMAGWTTPFTASAQVQCGNFYTIKLKIADVSDGAYNSAVFLEAQSFKSPEIAISPNLNSGNSFVDSNIVEGCSPSTLVFEKKGNVGVAMDIALVYSGTAVNGIDYATLPDTLHIASGVQSDSLVIEAFDDGIAEGNESIIVTMQPVTTVCYQYPPKQMTFYIRDKQPMTASAATAAASKDTIYCPGDTVTLIGAFAGGEGMQTGWWDDDTTALATRVLQPTQTTTYYYKATDECASDTAIDSVTIYLANYDPMEYNVDTAMVCRGDTANFILDVTKGRPPYYITWPDSSNFNWFSDVPSDTTFYPFRIIDGCGVEIKDSMMAYVAPDPLASFSFMNDYGVPLRVEFTNKSVNAASWLWDFGNGDTSTLDNPIWDFPKPGTYPVTLSIVSAEGCKDVVVLNVTVETDFYIYVPTAFTPDGDGLNECFEIKGVGFDSFEMKVFDRWGNMVFYTESIEDCWDGTINGQPAPQAVYTYSIFLRLPFDKIDQRNGMITLYR